jgi:hypothetical protein
MRHVDGVERWPPVHEPVQALVVHHTRTANGPADHAATIRGVYRFHADVRGWGDIGYHYLVAPDGLVYAGRWDGGGDGPPPGLGVVAGHALGHNVGTEGIGVLGRFDHEGPTAEAEEALVGLLAARCWVHGIDPLGTSGPLGPEGRRFPTIMGHGDCRPTTCPGPALAASLPRLRAAVAAQLDELELPGGRAVSA